MANGKVKKFTQALGTALLIVICVSLLIAIVGTIFWIIGSLIVAAATTYPILFTIVCVISVALTAIIYIEPPWFKNIF